MPARGGRARARSRVRSRRPFFLTVAGLVILSLTFALGVAVGRHWAGNSVPPAESGQQRPGAGRRRALSDVTTVKPPKVQGKLTFYRTLTGPAVPMPPPSRPPTTGSSGRARRAPEGSAASVSGADGPYTVQVVAYRTRTAAHATERKLRDAGFQAYVISLQANGRTTYRVRVGRFATRARAEQLAERLRKEHGLTPFVTTR